MKKLILILFLAIGVIPLNAQVASRILSSQAIPTPSQVRNYIWVDNTPGAMNRLWTGNMDSMRVYIFQTPWIEDTIESVGNGLWYSLNNPRKFISRGGISMTNIGMGMATYDTTTGILNIPTPQYYSAGTGLSLTGTTFANTGDLSVTNEIQNLTLSGATLGISGANTVNLPTYSAGTGISITSNVVTNTSPDVTVNISGTGRTTVSGSYPTYSVNTPAQTISRNNGTVTLTGGGSFNLPDSSSTNEIQNLGLLGTTLSLSNGGGSVSIPGGTVTSVGISSTDLSVSGSPVTSSGNITLNLNNSGVTAGTYDWVTVDAKGRVTSGTNAPAPTAISAGARNFNTAYQISSTRPSKISVSTSVSVTIGVLGSVKGEAILEISPNGSTGWIYIGEILNSSTLVGLTTVNGAAVDVELPAGYYWRLRTVDTVTGLNANPVYAFLGGSFWVY